MKLLSILVGFQDWALDYDSLNHHSRMFCRSSVGPDWRRAVSDYSSVQSPNTLFRGIWANPLFCVAIEFGIIICKVRIIHYICSCYGVKHGNVHIIVYDSLLQCSQTSGHSFNGGGSFQFLIQSDTHSRTRNCHSVVDSKHDFVVVCSKFLSPSLLPLPEPCHILLKDP